MRKQILSILTLSLSAIFLIGCDKQTPPEQMKSGEELYGYYCLDCHARKGPGAYMERYADKEPMKAYKIILMIKYGYDQGHQMPVFEQMSEKQAGAVAQYAHNLHTHATQSK